MPESDAVKNLQDQQLPIHLAAYGVTLEQVCKAVEEAKGRGVQIVFQQNVATAIVDAGPFFKVSTEHLLLGLMGVPDCAKCAV